MIKIDYDEIASRIANCSKVSDCQDIFKNWESLSNPLKLDLSKKYIDLAIDVNKGPRSKVLPLGGNKLFGTLKEKAKPSLKVPSQEVANSLEVLLENDQIGLVKDFLRPYQYLIPEFKVVRQDVSKEMTFVADWVVKLLKKENSKTHIEATTDYVNQLTLFGVTKPRADFLAFMQVFICVVSLGLAVRIKI